MERGRGNKNFRLISCALLILNYSDKTKNSSNSRFSLQAVYIAPLKALVRERMEDWKVRFEQKLGKQYVRCTVFL